MDLFERVYQHRFNSPVLFEDLWEQSCVYARFEGNLSHIISVDHLLKFI